VLGAADATPKAFGTALAVEGFALAAAPPFADTVDPFNRELAAAPIVDFTVGTAGLRVAAAVVADAVVDRLWSVDVDDVVRMVVAVRTVVARTLTALAPVGRNVVDGFAVAAAVRTVAVVAVERLPMPVDRGAAVVADLTGALLGTVAGFADGRVAGAMRALGTAGFRAGGATAAGAGAVRFG